MGLKILPAKFRTRLFYSTLLAGSMICPVMAAEDALVDAAIVSYEPVYFEKFSPVTLLDMLQRIPGVPEVLNNNRRGGNQRGFGGGGDQILIDGKRLAGKSNNINDALSRISADQVAKIELIRGATSGLDVQSQGLVINILLVEGGSKSSTFWKAMGEYTFGHKFLPQFLISHSGSAGNLGYTISAETKNDNGYRPRHEIFYDNNDVETGTRDVEHEFKFKGYKFTTNLNYAFENGSELRINGLYEPNGFDYHETRAEYGDDPDNVIWDQDRNNSRWEVGGDFSTDLGALGRFKTLFVVNRNSEDTEIDRTRDYIDPLFIYANEFTNEVNSEKILRSSTIITLWGEQSIELGGEAAITTFEKTFESYSRDIEADPLDLESLDNVDIKENRYEVFAIYNYNISPELLLQSSLTTEFSKIIADNIFQDGTFDRRDTAFTYFKPRVDLRYDYTDVDQIRGTIEKKVSQLRFDTFVTSYDAQNDQYSAGNTDLRPTQTWEFTLAYEHRLPNDTGSLEGKAYYHYRKDHQTRIDFTDYYDYDGNPVSVDEFFALPPDMALRDTIDFTPSQGNIDHAYIYGVDLKSNLRMGFVGVPEAVLSLGYRFEKRRSMDQFTQMMRNFSRHSNNVFNVNFRHDVTKWGFAYGFDVEAKSNWATYDINYYQPQSPAAAIKAFAEYNLKSGIKMRIDLLEITGKEGHTTTFRYVDHIRFDELNVREERENKRPRAVQISLQGNF
ncbi:MAG: TonB-dependent receptor plug domain-containing protein [Alphaproteobacteria bacterium]|nr:TonB-dependent receptor plug domain-containing protein [Alphaproteobacteria bacterium]